MSVESPQRKGKKKSSVVLSARSFLSTTIKGCWLLNNSRAAAPLWGQSTQIPSDLSPIVSKTGLQSWKGSIKSNTLLYFRNGSLTVDQILSKTPSLYGSGNLNLPVLEKIERRKTIMNTPARYQLSLRWNMHCATEYVLLQDV